MTADLPTLRALEKRLNEATGPDRGLDFAIAEVCGAGLERYPTGHPTGKIAWPEDRSCRACPKFTASIDAAVALLERVLPGADWQISKSGGATVIDGALFGEAAETTPAIALCLALIRALIAKEEGNG